MATLNAAPETFLKRAIGSGARVLLVNPPVQERRYHWLRWNQPLELLKLSTWVKTNAKKADVRLFDFMAPDAAGHVPKHRVKETWVGAGDAFIWHFGKPFEAFGDQFQRWHREHWSPDVVIVSSLCSYWHIPIEKLLIELCMRLGSKQRKKTKLCLYGAYPKFESAHAGAQPDADVAFTQTVDTTGCDPDFELFREATGEPPTFYAFDVEDPSVADQVGRAVAWAKKIHARPKSRFPGIVGTFFNADVCSTKSQLEDVARVVEQDPKAIRFEGIAGIEPVSLTPAHVELLGRANVRSLFIEQARTKGGALNSAAYDAVRAALLRQLRAKRTGKSAAPMTVTGFVAIGLPDDDLDALVDSALQLNSWFQSIILKPFGYSPTIDPTPSAPRWPAPYRTSPQWFPYVGKGSNLSLDDYGNLVRFQNLLNRRVKGTTFDFLGHGMVAQLVRETLIGETWKRRSLAG